MMKITPAANSKSLHFKYRPDIDGLRALAVVSVILFHAGFQVFGGGFVGVDVFFVISGYLITTIVINEIEQGNFSIVNFYERRARRILPALFVMMLCCLPLAWLWLWPQDMDGFSKSLVAVVLFASNIFFWRTSGYFDASTELAPMLHTWSLSVEEQYYVFFPIFLMFCWRFGKKFVGVSIAVVALASLLAAQRFSEANPMAAFYLLPMRAWELMTGALVAFYYTEHNINRHNHIRSQLFSCLGFFLICCSIFVYDKQTPFPGFYALAPTVGAALIIAFNTNKTFVSQLLGSKLFVGVGLISYSAYLWHQPILAFARHRIMGEPSSSLLFVIFLGSFLLAYLSWRFVEKPFRNRHRFGRRHVFAMSAVVGFFFLLFGVVGHKTSGFAHRFTVSQRAVLYYGSDEYAARLYKGEYRMGDCFLEPNQSFNEFKASCAAGGEGSSALVLGDSHAAALSVGLRRYFKNVAQYNASGCPPIKDASVSWRPNCRAANDFVFEKIKELRPGKVFLHANWSLYKEQDPVANLYKSIELIKQALPNADIVVVGSVPQWQPSLPIFLVSRGLGVDREQYLPSSGVNDLMALDKKLQEVAQAHGVKFVSLLDAVCRAGECLAVAELGGRFYPTSWDYAHLTEEGSVLFAGKVLSK